MKKEISNCPELLEEEYEYSWMDEKMFDEEVPQNPITGKEYETCVGVMKKLATYSELNKL